MSCPQSQNHATSVFISHTSHFVWALHWWWVVVLLLVAVVAVVMVMMAIKELQPVDEKKQ